MIVIHAELHVPNTEGCSQMQHHVVTVPNPQQFINLPESETHVFDNNKRKEGNTYMH